MVKKTFRITTSLDVVESVGKMWGKSLERFPDAIEVAQLFKKNKNLNLIIDPLDVKFLVGSFSNNKPVGGRIAVLPDGKKLTKAYSLFASHLAVHDESSNSHWDVIFRNPNGKYAYLYTKRKDKASRKEKYRHVEDFSRCLPRLRRNLMNVLAEDSLALPMLILLKTKMRIGNEMYYLKNHHKGLTTLKKKNISVSGNKITFEYLAKDGVPQKTIEVFPMPVIKRLKQVLRKKKPNDFVFTNLSGNPFKDTDFEKAFEKYCGTQFYPHIVRSEYATSEARKFLNNHRKATKEDVEKIYLKIADKLGHKKFSKKLGDWEDSYQVTVHHYIQPEIVEKISRMIS